MPVFNILAPTFTACTLGFFVMGYAGCHAANYFGRLRRYLRGMHGFTAELPELTRSAVQRLLAEGGVTKRCTTLRPPRHRCSPKRLSPR